MTQMTDRFLRAGVPRTCWTLSATDRGQANITAWAKDQKQRQGNREGMLSAYVPLPHAAGRRSEDSNFSFAAETVELLARQAVVEGIPVKVVAFHHLVHTLEHPEAYKGQDIDPEERPRLTVFDLLGSGVIVVPHLPAPADADCTPYQYRSAVDFLLTHIYEGGAVVVGGREALSKRLQSNYPTSLERMLLVNSEFFGTIT